MSVTVISKKTVSSKSPYTGDTFQDLASKIIGRDGYMAGGATSDDGANIIVDPVTFIQRGIIAETEVPSGSITVPTGAEPWFIVAANPDDDPVSGVVLSVTRDLVSAANGVVVAFKTAGVWQNPASVDIRGASARAAEPGVETGSQPYFTLSGDNMDEIVLNRGRIVDPDGYRRDLPRDPTSSAKNFSATAVRAHPSKGRMDHVVMRQREAHSPETKHLIGPLFDDGSYGTFTKTGTRQGYYAKRGGTNNEQWFAYGSALDLRIMGGPTGAGFADQILLTGAGTIGEVWVAGQRTADDAIILLYTDGILLRMVSFNAATGVQIDAPVTIDLDGNAVTHVRAELDDSELIHIVYERDDGGAPTQQVYYTRRATATATFAQAAITHRIVHGSNTGKNDTYPDVAVDRHGNAHIVYTTGTGTNTFGDIVYAVYSQAGSLSVEQTHLAGSAVGAQASVTDKIGFVAVAYTSLKKARVTVTDFDEVFAVVAGDPGGGYGDVLLFSPGFSERLGFPIVGTGAGGAGSGLYGVDIESNELGELRIALASSLGGIFLDIKEIGLDTIFAPDGLIGSSLLRSATLAGPFSAYTALTDEDDPILRRGTIGDIRLSHRRNASNAAYIYEIGTLDEGSFAVKSQPHPKDLYLASFDVADDAGGIIPEEEIRLHNVRQKKMNYPFLVGIEGDFQGFNSIYEAVRSANVNGGEIVVRKGDYRTLYTGAFPGSVALASGVTLRGEGQVTFDALTFQMGTSLASFSVDNIDGDIVERTASFGATLRAGDVVNMATSGFHRVLAVLPPKGAYAGRLLLQASSPAAGVPVGASLVPYPSGNKIENIEANRINVYKSYQAAVRGVSFFGAGGVVAIDAVGAQHLLIENADFSKLGGTAFAIELETCYRPVVRGCKGTSGGVETIRIHEDGDTPGIYDCSSMLIQPINNHATPILTSGVDDGDLTGLGSGARRTTVVGEYLRTAGTDALRIQDENIRNGTAPSGYIPFSSGNAEGDKLPTAYKSIQGESEPSVLEALHIPENTRNDDQGAGIVRDGIPSLGAFPQLDVTSCNYFVLGALFESLAQNESSATVADTVYYWWLDSTGTLVRGTSFNPTSTGTVLVAKAKSSVANTSFEEFVDMRRFIRRGSRKRQIVVGPAPSGSSIYSERADFFTLEAALHWLELSTYSGPAEILIIGQLDYTNGESPININFQTNNMKSLVIRGLGEDAGIKWGQDSDLFRIVGLASENAANLAGQKASIRFHNLLFDSLASAGPNNTTLFRFDASYFTEISVDGCRTQSNPLYNWNHAVQLNCDADLVTIAENTFEARGLSATSGVIHSNDGSGNSIKNLYIFRNTVRADYFTATAGTIGISVGATDQKVWISENNIENGRQAPNNAFAKGIIVRPFNHSGGPATGARWICDNVIGNTEISDGTADFAIYVDVNFAGAGNAAPIYIVGNTIYDAWDYGIFDNFSFSDLKIVDNYIYAQDQGIEAASPAVIANNRVNVSSGTSTAGITAYEGNSVIAGNVITGVAQDGILVSDVGIVAIAMAIVGNSINGQWTLGGIRVRRNDCLVDSNIVYNSHSSGEAIKLNGFSRAVVTGNHAKGDGGGLVVDVGCADCAIAGNKFETDGVAVSLDGTRHTFTGNHCRSQWAFNSSSAATRIWCQESSIAGNYFGAYIGADYGSGGAGQKALEVAGPNNAFSGNVAENRGTHSSKATVNITAAGDNNTFVGNTIRNIGVGAVFTANAGATNEFGTAGAALPGANKQTAT